LSEHNDEVTLTFGNDVGDFFYQNEKGEWVSEDGNIVLPNMDAKDVLSYEEMIKISHEQDKNIKGDTMLFNNNKKQ